MIRCLTEDDIDRAVDIWYLASVKAHDFVPAEFWQAQRNSMRNQYLPSCLSWVYEDDGLIVGFISYYQGSIPALFVDPEYQAQGLGSRLLKFLQQEYPSLTLTVYLENSSALQFYSKHGFKVSEESVCEHTQHKQLGLLREKSQ